MVKTEIKPLLPLIKAPPLTSTQHAVLGLLSLLLVGFGQPVWHWSVGALSGIIGFAFFWRVLLDFPLAKSRFWLSTAWFTSVQLIQLSWMVYHPYAYIYFVYSFFALTKGLQFGIMGILVSRRLFERWLPLLGFAGLWTLMEWIRFFFLSGYTWNPVGLALTGNIYSLQAASLFGVFGLTFWVIFVNLAALRAWLSRPAYAPLIIWAATALLPTAYGIFHLAQHTALIAEAPKFRALLVQPAFPAEEALDFKELKHYVAFVLEEWKQIMNITGKHVNETVDLIALPEYVVPFGTYSFLYPYEVAASAIEETFGERAKGKLPPKMLPLAKEFNTPQGTIWAVNNAFWTQALANIFDAPVIVGLEDAEDIDETRERYSAALYFSPLTEGKEFQACRYAKRVLVPMAEYIPFSFCRQLAAQYGINGSFTCGQEAHVYSAGDIPFGVSICYEETFGELMAENRRKGAELLVNLTSDVWFPHSLLPYQHLEHSRLRSVENGIPLLRACNTGITTAIDSTGQTVAVLGETRMQHEWTSGCLLAEVPLYSYATLYTRYGDQIILLISLGFSLLWTGFSLLKIDPLF